MSETKPDPWDGWGVDEGDPSVGIFGTEFLHDACPKPYDEGCTYSESLVGPVQPNGFVDNQIDVTCHDCGAQTTLTDSVYVGPAVDALNAD